MAIRIEQVDAGSEAEALGLAPGDELLSVDDNELNDTLDYDFYTDSSSFHLKARVADGIREWDVQRAERGPFGCDFSTYLGDQKHSCSNHCMFCFIDQLPPGMRESLYFKDDDERLSFLFGNYITMTNMQDHEIDRIIKMHISPINICSEISSPSKVQYLLTLRTGLSSVPFPSAVSVLITFTISAFIFFAFIFSPLFAWNNTIIYSAIPLTPQYFCLVLSLHFRFNWKIFLCSLWKSCLKVFFAYRNTNQFDENSFSGTVISHSTFFKLFIKLQKRHSFT